MPRECRGNEAKPSYVEPRVLATFSKQELEDAIRPHGPVPSYTDSGCGTGCACGCACGCIGGCATDP